MHTWMDQVLHVCHGVHSELCLMGVVTVMRHMSALAPRLWALCDNKLVFTNLSIYLEGNTHTSRVLRRDYLLHRAKNILYIFPGDRTPCVGHHGGRHPQLCGNLNFVSRDSI